MPRSLSPEPFALPASYERGSLCACMEVKIRTGHTKSPRGVEHVALSFTSEAGERVCFLIEVHAESRDAKTFEKECMQVVQHAFLETEGDPVQRLDGTLKELNGLMKGIFLSRSIDDVHMILAVVDTQDTVHVSQVGRAEAYIVRGGGASQITEHIRGKPSPAFVHIATGRIEPQDILIFSTQRLLRTFTPVQLAQIAHKGDDIVDALTHGLESEDEHAALATFSFLGERPPSKGRLPSRGITNRARRGQHAALRLLPAFTDTIARWCGAVCSARFVVKMLERAKNVIADLGHPQRRRRAHLFLLAGILVALLLVWTVVQLSTSTQRGRTREDLRQLMEEVDTQIRSADNRRLAGDSDAANAILRRAEEQAKKVMENESGLFRVEALDMLDQIRSKSEEINNIVRLSPRVVVNLSTKSPDILAQGLIGVNDGEFIVYDRQNLHRVLLNAVDEPDRLSDDELIVRGTNFERYQTLAFATTDGNLIELVSGQPTSMKTEDPSGWIVGDDFEAYLRYLYVLSSTNNQIYKYERLSNRYSAPVEYNVNGDLSGALDMTIDGNVYILKKGGEVVKLLRGEAKSFVIRRAPDGLLQDATRIFKSFNGNLYFLDPVNARVIVATDGGATGESTYISQYILEGEHIGQLTDLFVDSDDAHLYVLDEKRLYVIDITK